MKIEKLSNIKLKIGESESVLYDRARRALKCEPAYFRILKKSLDARDKNNICYVYSIEFSAKNKRNDAKRNPSGCREKKRRQKISP